MSGAPLGALVEDRTDEIDAGPCGEQRGDAGRIVGRAGLVDRSADFVGDAGADRSVTRYGEGYS